MKPERVIKTEILRAIGLRRDLFVWNNPTGAARSMDGSRVITFGCPGSPDIIGLRLVTVDASMVGSVIGLAVGIEVKTEKGSLSAQQIAFRKRFMEVGGLYIEARDVDTVLRALK